MSRSYDNVLNMLLLLHSLLFTCLLQTSKSLKQADSSAAVDGRSIPMSARPGYTRPPGHRRPPWKGTDRTPQDTWRLNYLDNDDEIEKVNKLLVLLCIIIIQVYFIHSPYNVKK